MTQTVEIPDAARATLTMGERTVRRGRRIGRWQYVEDRWMGDRWRLDGTTVDLQFYPLGRSSGLHGVWYVWVGDVMHESIDHFLDGAKDWVEQIVDGRYADAPNPPRWAQKARTQLASHTKT